MSAINPQGLSVTAWADAVALTASGSWAVGRLDNPDDWQRWATGLLRAQPFTSQALPDPYQFSDWREWAQRAYPMLEVTA